MKIQYALLLSVVFLFSAGAQTTQAPQTVPEKPAEVVILPTPTPGLTTELQEVNYLLLTKGKVIKEVEVDGRKYMVRIITVENSGALVGIYNDKGHVLLMCIADDKSNYTLAPNLNDPVPEIEVTNSFSMDNVKYAVKTFQTIDGSMVNTVYNELGHFFLGVSDVNGLVFPNLNDNNTSKASHAFDI